MMSTNTSSKRTIIIIVLALIVIAGSFICGYQTCSKKEGETTQSIEKQLPERNSGTAAPITKQKNRPAPQPMNVEQKIQQKITEKIEKAGNPKETKSKNQRKDFDDEPVGNVVTW